MPAAKSRLSCMLLELVAESCASLRAAPEKLDAAGLGLKSLLLQRFNQKVV